MFLYSTLISKKHGECNQFSEKRFNGIVFQVYVAHVVLFDGIINTKEKILA